MSAERNLIKLQMKRFNVFKAQDFENGDFDIVFEIQGKVSGFLFSNLKLHTFRFYMLINKLILISSTFKSMLSDRWTKPNESIKIQGYSFEDFKEFLTFIYSGECQLTNENILTMVDIAEFFMVEELKEFCEEFNTGTNFDNIYQMIETAIKFSMETLKKATINYVSKNISTFLQSQQFCELKKSTLKEIIKLCGKTEHQEDIFKAVYQWAEKQAKEVVETDNGLNLNDAIKEQMSDFLPFIEYGFMETEFLTTFVKNSVLLI